MQSIDFDISHSKAAVRKLVAQRKKACPDSELAKMSMQITKRILSLEEYRKAGFVFAYINLPGEVQTRSLITQCLKDGKRVAVPRVMAGEKKNEMQFYEIDGFGHLVRGAMNIPEPDLSFCACADGEEEALIIMPGVAFDRKLNRIGYGGGFYDRYLQVHSKHFTVAAAYGFQVFGTVPGEEMDIRPQILVTPSETIRR